jgi:hypothetical protein
LLGTVETIAPGTVPPRVELPKRGVMMFRRGGNTRAHDLGCVEIGLGLILLALIWGQKPSVLAHPSPPPEGYVVLSWATSARNHQFLFSPLFTIFMVLGVTAASPEPVASSVAN